MTTALDETNCSTQDDDQTQPILTKEWLKSSLDSATWRNRLLIGIVDFIAAKALAFDPVLGENAMLQLQQPVLEEELTVFLTAWQRLTMASPRLQLENSSTLLYTFLARP